MAKLINTSIEPPLRFSHSKSNSVADDEHEWPIDLEACQLVERQALSLVSDSRQISNMREPCADFGDSTQTQQIKTKKEQRKRPKGMSLREFMKTELSWMVQVEDSAFAFEDGASKNPLRPGLIVFSAVQLYLFLCFQIVWPLIASKDTWSDEVSQGSVGTCHANIMRGVAAALLQGVNLFVWLRRSSYCKKWHLAHNFVTCVSLLANASIKCDSQLTPFAIFVYTQCNMSQVALFSKMTALSPLHMVLIWLVAVSVHLVIFSLAFSQPLLDTDTFIIVNCLIAAAVLPFSLTFRSLHPPKEKDSRDPSPLLEYEAPAPERQVDAPAPERQVDVPAQERQVDVPAPERQVDVPAQERQVDVPAPERQVDAPAPERQVDVPAPGRQVDAPAPERQVDVPAPERQVDVPAPGRQVDAPAPERQVDVPAQERQVDVPAPGRQVDAPAPERQVDVPAQERQVDVPAPERQVDAPAPERQDDAPVQPDSEPAVTEEEKSDNVEVSLLVPFEMDEQSQSDGDQMSQDIELTQVVLEQLTSGVAITEDWSAQRCTNFDTDSIVSEDDDCDSARENSMCSLNISSGSSRRFKKKVKTRLLQESKKLINTISSKKTDLGIFLSNDQIYSIIGGLRPTRTDSQLLSRPDYSDARIRNKIFTKRCLLQVENVEEENGAGSPEEVKLNVQSLKRLGTVVSTGDRKLQSLKSLAHRYGDFQGYFHTATELFNFQEGIDAGRAEELISNHFLSKILKVEIKRITVKDNHLQLFVISDITKFQQNQRAKLKHTFSKQLTASLCHEVMTPLNSILNISDFFHHNLVNGIEPDSKNKLEMVTQLHSSSKFMHLMLLSQMSSQKHGLKQLILKFEPLELPIDQFFCDFLKPYLPQAQQKQLRVVLKQANNIPLDLCSDWTVYSTILFHLMQNAFKFSQVDGEVTITVSYHKLDRVQKPADGEEGDETGYLLTVVQDQGLGIPESDFTHLFTTFNSSSSQGYFATRGIGIGLSTAKTLSLALQGAIHLNSKVGQGTQVAFSVMTRKSIQRINSKDLKTQTLGMVEGSFFVGLGGPVRGSNKTLSSKALSHKWLRQSSLMLIARERFNCFFASVLQPQLLQLHHHHCSQDQLNLPEVVLINERNPNRNARLHPALQVIGGNQQVIPEVNESDSSDSNSVSSRSNSEDKSSLSGEVGKLDEISFEKEFSRDSQMNESLQGRFGGKDSELSSPLPQETKKKHGIMSERNSSSLSQLSRGLSAPLSYNSRAKRAPEDMAALQSPYQDVERSLREVFDRIQMGKSKAQAKGYSQVRDRSPERHQIVKSHQAEERKDEKLLGGKRKKRAATEQQDLCPRNSKSNELSQPSVEERKVQRKPDGQPAMSSREVKIDQPKLLNMKMNRNEGRNRLIAAERAESREEFKLEARSISSRQSFSQEDLASEREEDAKQGSSEGSEGRQGMKSGQIEEENKTCCSKAEVLLVDDVLFNLLPLKALIETKYKRKCDEAVDGLIAVKMYNRNMTKTCCNVRYQTIFTDIQMPEMDGISEAKQIQADERELLSRNPNLPKVHIVMVSAYDDEETIKKCNDIGIYDYITKPVSVTKLYPICDKVFATPSQAEQPAQQ